MIIQVVDKLVRETAKPFEKLELLLFDLDVNNGTRCLQSIVLRSLHRKKCDVLVYSKYLVYSTSMLGM